MPGFVTDVQLTQALADRLKQAVAALPAYYTSTIVPRANIAAYQEIVGRLLARGFAPSQIAAWDRGAEFQYDLGCFFAIVYSGLYAGYDQKTLELMDRRKELTGTDDSPAVQVFVNGKWVQPDDTQGNPTTGPPVTTGSIFNWPDPEDPSLGKYTRW